MQFFIRGYEREPQDPPEEAAMTRYRLESNQRLIELLGFDRPLTYAFRTEDNHRSYMLFDVDSLEELDQLIKADSLFPYSTFEIVPVISGRHMAEEIQAYLSEVILSDDELRSLEARPVQIDPIGVYYIADKQMPSFSSLLPEPEQREIHRRTLVSQRLHDSPLEISDVNPVGRMEGILVLRASSNDEVATHLQRAPIYSDTNVRVERVLTLEQSSEIGSEWLQRYRNV